MIVSKPLLIDGPHFIYAEISPGGQVIVFALNLDTGGVWAVAEEIAWELLRSFSA